MVNTRKKGNRNERKVEEELQDDGYYTTRMPHTRYGPNDFWGLIDIIATHPEKKPRAIQVKTNTADGITKFADKCDEIFNLDVWICEMAVVMDYKGIRIHRIDKETLSMEKIRDDRDG